MILLILAILLLLSLVIGLSYFYLTDNIDWIFEDEND